MECQNSGGGISPYSPPGSATAHIMKIIYTRRLKGGNTQLLLKKYLHKSMLKILSEKIYYTHVRIVRMPAGAYGSMSPLSICHP